MLDLWDPWSAKEAGQASLRIAEPVQVPLLVAGAVYASGGPWKHCGLKGNVSLNSELDPFS